MAAFYYGGQAVLEGVMMRGRRHMAVAVRAPDGRIVVHEEPLTGQMVRVAGWPLVRGIVLLWESLALGMRSLRFSAAVAESGAPPDDAQPPHSAPLMAGVGKDVNGAMLASLAFGVGLFFVLPLLLVGWADQYIMADWVSNGLEGAIRLTLLLGYIVLVGRVPEIRRVFGYHGAEHKTINAYEAGAPLTPDAVQRFSVVHPRCGTTFLLIVVACSILFFTLLGRPPMGLRILSRIVLVPLVAAVAYEVIRWAAGHLHLRLVRLLMAPGLALQRLTTRPPDDSMVEVGIVALTRVLVVDGVLAAEPEPAAAPGETPGQVAPVGC